MQQQYSTDSQRFSTLQQLVTYEIQKQHHVHANSATNSLLWLKR